MNGTGKNMYDIAQHWEADREKESKKGSRYRDVFICLSKWIELQQE